MARKRAILWVLTATSTVFPAWLLVYWTTGIDAPFPDLVMLALVVVVPFMAMASLMIWALRVGNSSTATPDSRKRTVSLVLRLGYIGAFIVLNRAIQHDV